MPRLQALVLADNIYQDARSGKKVIAGTFNHIFAKEVGEGIAFGRNAHAYICLTDIRGDCQLTLRYVDLHDETPLMATSFTVHGDDPLKSLELLMEMPPLPLPHEGVYALEILNGDNGLGSLRIAVSLMPGESEGADEKE